MFTENRSASNKLYYVDKRVYTKVYICTKLQDSNFLQGAARKSLDNLKPGTEVRSQVSLPNLVVLRQTRNGTRIRNSAIADKPRDAFRGESRSPNMVPFHMNGMVF